MKFTAVGAAVAAASIAMPLASQANVARIGPLTVPDPLVNTAVISAFVNVAGVAAPVRALQQCELRSLGGGLYRVAATEGPIGADLSLITGTLNLGVFPPLWTPNADVNAFNASGINDEYQLSISQDGRTAVWDVYPPARTYPNGATGTTFVCYRTLTTAPFPGANIRAIAPGVGQGGVDPHIGEELPGGNVVLYYIYPDPPIPGINTGDIVKAVLNPLTGALGAPSLVAPYTVPGGTGWNHSPFVHRDSTGQARALNYSQIPATGGTTLSDAVFTEGVANNGTPEVVLDGTAAGVWFNNPGLVGGSWHYCTSGNTQPQLQEVSMIANTDLRPGSGRVAAWAPARPLPGSMPFVSIVGIGSLAPPYPIPPVINDIWIFPNVGVLPIRYHDQYTGLAEWVFSSVPLFNVTWQMQLITLDAATSTFFASNTALLLL
jgi:hypothetical protein